MGAIISWFYTEPELLEQPWKSMPERKEVLKFVGTRQFNKAKCLRVLLHGPVGAGKSSFINSVCSALQGRITTLAPTNTSTTVSFTEMYRSYKIPCRPGSKFSLSFSDVMGFEKNEGNGVNVTDLILALKGHIKEGYTFSPNHPITEDDPKYNKSPTNADRIHFLVCVFSADSAGRLSDQVLSKVRHIQLEASKLEIPQLTIFTRVDQACPEVQKDIRTLYQSKYLKEKVDKHSAKMSLQKNNVFLVKNYESEILPDPDVDAPILCALRRIVSDGEKFLNKM